MGELISSVCICLVVIISLTPSLTHNIVEPLIIESRLVTFGRYGFANEAINSISDDEVPSVVAIGSSMMYKAFDGNCMGQQSDVNDAKFYNLGIPASRPYTDMMQIPRLSQSGVEVVLVEVGVNLLFEINDGPHEYMEFRFTIQTMLQDDRDLGEWVDVVLPYHQQWLYLNEYERTVARQEWFVESTEILLERMLNIEEEEDIKFRFLPEPGTDEWLDYLQEPGWPASLIDNEWKRGMSEDDYNETVLMVRSSYEPQSNGTRNHDALDYIVSELVDSGVKVILVGLPHHPLKYPYLDPGQWDGYNDTVNDLVEEYDVTLIDFTFEQKEGWGHEHFYDGNHLDEEGRVEFCQRMTPILNSALES